MRSFYCEVFIDDRPVHQATVTTGQPHTAAARAMREAVKNKIVKHRPEKYVVRLTKIYTK